jgi:probable DNA repair protein
MTVVTANTRLARRLRREFDRERKAAGERFWESPDILPWRAWLARLWTETVYTSREERVLLSRSQEQVLWEQAIQRSAEGAELLNPAGTAVNAAQAWEVLHNWRLPKLEEAFAEVPDTAAFFGWMQSFQIALKNGGFVTAAELPDLIRAAGFEPPDAHAGFDELTPVQSALFEGVKALPIALPEVGSLRQVGLPGAPDEIWFAARWARAHLERNPAARVGVAFPDLRARRMAVHRIFREVLGTPGAFHVSTSTPLREVPMIAAALMALKLCSGMTLAEAGVLLRSPFFRHTAQEGARVDASLRRRGVAGVIVSRPEIASLFPGLAVAQGTKRLDEWSATFSKLVVATGWPGTRTLSNEEHQAAESWKDLLGEFARLDAVLGDVAFGAALGRLENLAMQIGFDAKENDEPVQVIDVLEAAGAKFDALWIGGLHDGAWPPMGRPNPFLPLTIQRAGGAPNSSVEQQYGYASRVTARLLRSASEVVCSYPLLHGEEALRASPLIAGLEIMEPNEPEPVSQAAELEEVTRDAAPPFEEGSFMKGGMSVLADQSACPFRAFAKYRLGARALDEIEPGLSDRERGTVVHLALELIWSELKSQKALIEASQGQLDQLIERSIWRALEEKLGDGSRRLTQMQSLEVRRLLKVLGEWLEIEKRRRSFETHQLEAKRRYTVAGLELDIRADRVDRYEDGSVAILDYKTGLTSNLKHWETERPEAPQLPLYSVATEERISTVAFAQLAVGKMKLIGLSECGDLGLKPPKGIDLEEQIDEWRGVVNALARGFVEGDAAVNPRDKACAYCDLAGLCRVSAHGEEESIDG